MDFMAYDLIRAFTVSSLMTSTGHLSRGVACCRAQLAPPPPAPNEATFHRTNKSRHSPGIQQVVLLKWLMRTVMFNDQVSCDDALSKFGIRAHFGTCTHPETPISLN